MAPYGESQFPKRPLSFEQQLVERRLPAVWRRKRSCLLVCLSVSRKFHCKKYMSPIWRKSYSRHGIQFNWCVYLKQLNSEGTSEQIYWHVGLNLNIFYYYFIYIIHKFIHRYIMKLILWGSQGVMEQIWRKPCTVHQSITTYRDKQPFTLTPMDNLESPINSTPWTVWRTWRKPTQTRGEHRKLIPNIV